MASITKLNDKWRVRVSWYDSTGTRRFKSKAGFSTKAEASRWARSMEIKKTIRQSPINLSRSHSILTNGSEHTKKNKNILHHGR